MEKEKDGKKYKMEWDDPKPNLKSLDNIPKEKNTKVTMEELMASLDFTHTYRRPLADTKCGNCLKKVRKGQKMRLYSANLGAISLKQAAVCKPCFKGDSYPIKKDFIQGVKNHLAGLSGEQISFLIQKGFPKKKGGPQNGN